MTDDKTTEDGKELSGTFGELSSSTTEEENYIPFIVEEEWGEEMDEMSFYERMGEEEFFIEESEATKEESIDYDAAIPISVAKEPVKEESVVLSTAESKKTTTTETEEIEEMLFGEEHEEEAEIEEEYDLEALQKMEDKLLSQLKARSEEMSIETEEIVEEEDVRSLGGIPELLDELINQVVDTFERLDYEANLRMRFDKRKLIAALEDLQSRLIVESRKRFYFYRKAVEYFRKKNHVRALAEDDPESIVTSLNTYRGSLIKLHKLRNRQANLKTHYADLSKTLDEQIVRRTKQFKKEEASVNAMLRAAGEVTLDSKTGDVVSSERIEAMIKFMNNQRELISDVRYELIKLQHKYAVLIEELKKLDFVGEGFYLGQYESLQAQNRTLGEKIEERTNELKRLQTRYKNAINLIAHYREKEYMLKQDIIAAEEKLKEEERRQNFIRRNIYDLRMQRKELRDKQTNMSFNAGLLGKVILLHDYDKTQEDLEEMQGKIDKLRAHKEEVSAEMEDIMKKIARLEGI